MDKNLRAFLAVVRNHSLTAASDKLALTQSSVTKRIANLEAETGASLFDRNRRGMTLTKAGQLFLKRAERIEDEYRQSQEEISSLLTMGLEVIRVGAGPVFHLSCMARLFIELKQQFPNLTLELSTDIQRDIGSSLKSGMLDVYLGIVPHAQLDETIHVKYVTNVEHGIVIRADNPLARQTHVDPIDLSDSYWVIFAFDPETERRIQQYTVPEVRIASGIDVRTTSFATGLQLVKEGNFVMSAPLQLAERVEREGLVIRPTTLGMPRRQAGLHVRKSSLGFNTISAVLEFFDTVDFDIKD